MQQKPRRLVLPWRIALREDERLSRSAKLLGYTLATYADNTTGKTFVGLVVLGRNCRFSARTAHTAAKELERWGYVDIERRAGLSSVYTLRRPRKPASGPPRKSATRTPEASFHLTHKNSAGGVAEDDAPPVPLDDCASCGRVRPLVRDGLYCQECK
jgi:hypothetical protein